MLSNGIIALFRGFPSGKCEEYEKLYREVIKMICTNCGRECSGSLRYCRLCGADLMAQNNAATKEFSPFMESESGSKSEPQPKKPVKEKGTVSAGIYKFLCVCMGLCLISGSVLWAAIFLRDRIDSPVRAEEAVPVAEAPAEETVTKKETTTTKPTTTTTTTTTTTDPYKQTVEPQMIDDYGTMYVIADELIMRIGPGYDYDRLDSMIPNGTELDVQAEQIDAKSGESWCYVTYGTDTGWVSKSFLSLNNPTVAVVLPDDFYYDFQRDTATVVRDGGLKLYSGPGTSYDIIATLDEGDTVTKEGYNYFSVKWIYVSYGDQNGWIQTYDGDWLNPTIE